MKIIKIFLAIVAGIIFIEGYILWKNGEVRMEEINTTLETIEKEYINPIAKKYNVSDLKRTGTSENGYICYNYTSETFEKLSDETKYEMLCELLKKVHDKRVAFPRLETMGLKTTTESYCIDIVINGYCIRNRRGGLPFDLHADLMLYKRGKFCYAPSKKSDSNSSSSNTTTQKVTCSICNGTGYVKSYYGDSALEAWLNGKNDYEYIKCSSCKGLGYTYKKVSGNSGAGKVICDSCSKWVSEVIAKKDAAGVTRKWCSSCWARYNAIMGK